MNDWYSNPELHDEDYTTLSSLFEEDDPWDEDPSAELYDDGGIA